MGFRSDPEFEPTCSILRPRWNGWSGAAGVFLAVTLLLNGGCGSDSSAPPASKAPPASASTPAEPGTPAAETATESAASTSPGTDAAAQADGAVVATSGGTARIPMRSDGPKSLDPIRGSTVYENQCASQLVETLLQYKYLKRPFELEPLLLAEMPTSADGLTWKFRLKPNVRFHDDGCFPDGKGRPVVSADVFYSWKRMADVRRANSKVWWLMQDTIVGFDEYQKAQNEAEKFDYDAPVEGLKIVSDQEFEVTLTKPRQSFLWKLAMFQTGVVARESVEKYGDRFGLRPIGTGPFVLKEGDWKQDQGIRFTKNPNYHECWFPEEHMPDDEADGIAAGKGQRLPILDAVDVVFYKTDQPMWLEFQAGKLDFVQVPAESFEEAFTKRTKKLTSEMRARNMKGYPVPLLDFIFRGFNMEDPLLGGYTPEKKALRQAICLALDWDEQNEAFYNGINVVYDGVIPPGLEGHPEGGQSDKAYRGPNVQRAKERLAAAGYPEGKGLPTIDYYTAKAQNGQEQSEMLQKQLAQIGVNVKVHLLDFSQLMQKVDEKTAPLFSFAWGSDYPDGENNLALFYGPNESPGANHFNFKNPEYDRLYEQIVVMPPSPERLKIYQQMQEILLEDCPYTGSMARTRFYVVTPRLKYFRPVETFENWYKYLGKTN
jgi:oligopeptide transport system substrate-binding protein